MVASSGPYCELHYYQSKKVIVTRSMKNILYDHEEFIRINNSEAIRLSEIVKLENYEIEIVSGEKFTISRRKLNRIKKNIEKAIIFNTNNPNFL